VEDLSSKYISIHQEMKEFNVSPLCLLLNPKANKTEHKQIPLSFYETTMCSSGSDIFVEIPFKVCIVNLQVSHLAFFK
jgi:hypothetical protein